jgi:serine/threonine protein kinase
LFKGDVPFFSEEETKKAQYELSDTHISSEAKDLLAKCFEIDPKKRITALQALEHPWFKSLSKNEPTPKHVQDAMLNFVSANDFAKSMVSVLVGLHAQQEDIEKAQ